MSESRRKITNLLHVMMVNQTRAGIKRVVANGAILAVDDTLCEKLDNIVPQKVHYAVYEMLQVSSEYSRGWMYTLPSKYGYSHEACDTVETII